MTRIPLAKPRIPTFDTRIVPRSPKLRERQYGTAAHREWAAEVIRRAGGKCQDPTCRAIHYAGQRMFADHVVEIRDRPDLALNVENGRALCGSAHTRKTAAEKAKRAARAP